MKSGGQHAHNRVRNIAEGNGFAQDISVRRKTLLPRPITQNHGLLGARLIFSRPKIPSEERIDAQRTKETVAYPGAGHFYPTCRRMKRQQLWPVHVERAQHPIEPFPIEIVGVGQVVSLPDRDTFKKRHQPRWIAIWQWLHHGRIDKGEDRGTCTDT